MERFLYEFEFANECWQSDIKVRRKDNFKTVDFSAFNPKDKERKINMYKTFYGLNFDPFSKSIDEEIVFMALMN